MNFGGCQGSFLFSSLVFVVTEVSMKLHSSLPEAPWYVAFPCAAAVLAFVLCTVVRATALQSGTQPVRAAVGLLMILPLLLALFLLQSESCPPSGILDRKSVV